MNARRNGGVVLVVVLFFALLLTSTVTTFLKRATVDSLVARNREASSRADALARGGIRLGTALVLEHKLRLRAAELPVETRRDLWATISGRELDAGEGAVLELAIDDMGSKLNLNALFDHAAGGSPHEHTESLLAELFAKVIDEMDATPAEKELYDVSELAKNLIDWVDADDLRQGGGVEDDYYQRQTPPYAAANHALLSVPELRLIEGFDAPLVSALEQYVTVYPFLGRGGVNPNTAPPHVLALLYANDGVRLALASEENVADLVEAREAENGVVCGAEINAEDCTPITEVMGPNEIFPPPTWESNAYRIRATGVVGEVRRTVDAVVDVTQPAEPLLLSWQLR